MIKIQTDKVPNEKDKYETILYYNNIEATVFNYYLRDKNYSSSQTEKKYPNGLFVDGGAFTMKDFRNKKLLTILLYETFLSIPDDICLQFAVQNRKLIPFYDRLGFKKVQKIDYWGKVSNTKNFELEKLTVKIKKKISDELNKILNDKGYKIEKRI